MTDDVSLRSNFQKIYDTNEWGHGSGPGSSPTHTIEYRAFLSRFIVENGIRSVTDLGCGDWQFSRFLDWSNLDYTGFDVVPMIVERNQRLFGLPNVRFEIFTSLESLPGGDLLLAKEVLQHLPNAAITEYLAAIRQRYRFALLTNATTPRHAVNIDIEPGGFRPICLQDPPFSITGAIAFTYFVPIEGITWKNAVFLMMGEQK
jgi:SAM-dependent methyltransferase